MTTSQESYRFVCYDCEADFDTDKDVKEHCNKMNHSGYFT